MTNYYTIVKVAVYQYKSSLPLTLTSSSGISLASKSEGLFIV